MEHKDELLQKRHEKLDYWVKKGIDPFGGKFEHTAIGSLLADFKEGATVKIAGRLFALRRHGKSIFGDLRDATAKLQLYINRDVVGDGAFTEVGQLDIGDVIGVEGALFKTHTGEPTVKVTGYTLLSKSLRPLPEKWHGLKDIEVRYRKRYLDLLANHSVKEAFLLRSKMIGRVRAFLDERGFIEVETPAMQALAGGAAARPFKTHHNALDLDLYLRIAPELYLKRLLVGGFDKVYELGRNFRNEGISTRHNPEFTMLEVYEAYAECKDMMVLVQELFKDVARALFNKEAVAHEGKEIDLSGEWKSISFFDALQEKTGVDFKKEKDFAAAAKKLGIEHLDAHGDDYEILNKVFDKCVQPTLTQPTFIIEYPYALCPLAKQNSRDKALAERFELFVCGQEVANAYSEQNSPIVQKKRFEEQTDDTAKIDHDYIEALEYGMPPAAGLGVGIDRLAMLMLDQPSIRDVILFPQLKPAAE
jgi:lysyl-tRNA synthetase class 2